MNWIQRWCLTFVAVAAVATVPVAGSRPSCPSPCCNPAIESKTPAHDACATPVPPYEDSGCCKRAVPTEPTQPTATPTSTCCPSSHESSADDGCCPSGPTAQKPGDPKCPCIISSDEIPTAVPPAVQPSVAGEWILDLPILPQLPEQRAVRRTEPMLDAGDSSPPPRHALPPDAPRAPPTF